MMTMMMAASFFNDFLQISRKIGINLFPSVMALILHYFTKFGSFQGTLHKSG